MSGSRVPPVLKLMQEDAVLALFACLALGFLIGKLRVGPVAAAAASAGSWCVSMLLGAQTVNGKHIAVNSDVKNIMFALFIFSLGYIAGPGFVANLNPRGLRFGVLSLMEMIIVLVIAVGITKVANLDTGTGAGILAGSATESAVVGTAQDAIGKLPGSPRARSRPCRRTWPPRTRSATCSGDLDRAADQPGLPAPDPHGLAQPP